MVNNHDYLNDTFHSGSFGALNHIKKQFLKRNYIIAKQKHHCYSSKQHDKLIIPVYVFMRSDSCLPMFGDFISLFSLDKPKLMYAVYRGLCAVAC